MLPRLQFLTLDAAPWKHREQAQMALTGGVRWIQLRTKVLSVEAWLDEAHAISLLCREYEAIFIVNDSPEIALAAKAHGVHLGSNDIAPSIARAYLGPKAIIGVTLNETAHLNRLENVRVDYAGVGPFRHTVNKQPLAPVHTTASLSALIAAAAPLPCYGVGGIKSTDWPSLRNAGAHGIAVSGSIALATDPIAAAQELRAAIRD